MSAQMKLAGSLYPVQPG